MKFQAILVAFVLFSSCMNSQNNQNKNTTIGGPCEGCEAIYEYGDRQLKPVDTLPKFRELDYPLKISGTVYQSDGKTPAKDVILYVYHTNSNGKYPTHSDSNGWERRHGYLRGWIKTNERGYYEFYTSRPASYPNSSVPQHIHITVKEPGKNEYYVEDFYFKDDPHITPNILNRKRPRGGSGVIQLRKEGDLWVAERNIILGLNIPNYD